MNDISRHFLFLVASARHDGNTETLARHAAAALPAECGQRWLHLADLPLPAFEDVRHSGNETYPPPTGHGRTLLDATLAATDLVFVVPLYWYGVPASAKLYLDHWSGWMRVPDIDFKARMADKTMWGISVYSDRDPKLAEPLFGTLKFSADYMAMRYGGSLLGYGNRPGEVLSDAAAFAAADRLFETARRQLHRRSARQDACGTLL